jgi:hypothetical protein
MMTIYATPERDKSDVRIQRTAGQLVCAGCPLTSGPVDAFGFQAEDIPTMLDHLDFHALVGHYVPPATFLRLRSEHADEHESGAL